MNTLLTVELNEDQAFAALSALDEECRSLSEWLADADEGHDVRVEWVMDQYHATWDAYQRIARALGLTGELQ